MSPHPLTLRFLPRLVVGRLSKAALAGTAFCLLTSGMASALNGRFEAVAGEFLLHLEDGRILRREALIGATLIMPGSLGQLKARIEGIEEDTTAPGGPILLYRLSIEDPASGRFRNICRSDALGRQAGFPIPKEKGFDFTCTSGAEGKCILMGYRPWNARIDVPMQELYRACIRMVRADYGGDDHPATQDGMLIDVYDRFGIQNPSTETTMPFEAAWGPNGALCVAHPRVARNVTLEDLAQRYFSLRGRLGPNDCNEEKMRNDPQALLFNRSAISLP